MMERCIGYHVYLDPNNPRFLLEFFEYLDVTDWISSYFVINTMKTGIFLAITFPSSLAKMVFEMAWQEHAVCLTEESSI